MLPLRLVLVMCYLNLDLLIGLLEIDEYGSNRLACRGSSTKHKQI